MASIKIKRKKNPNSRPTRVSKELMEIINFVRAKYIMEGKPAPRIAYITRVIAKRIDKEDILHDMLIRF